MALPVFKHRDLSAEIPAIRSPIRWRRNHSLKSFTLPLPHQLHFRLQAHIKLVEDFLLNAVNKLQNIGGHGIAFVDNEIGVAFGDARSADGGSFESGLFNPLGPRTFGRIFENRTTIGSRERLGTRSVLQKGFNAFHYRRWIVGFQSELRTDNPTPFQVG